jgi:hypothetical protein
MAPLGYALIYPLAVPEACLILNLFLMQETAPEEKLRAEGAA